MKQILHIFKKDARHNWPQIGLLLIILAAYSWSEIRGWQARDFMSVWYQNVLAPATILLVVAGWWSLLGRSIQDEKLVGDKQFWVTRPYRWLNLLGAKALFALTFINLPLLVVQLVLLAAAGFNPWHYVPDLLWMQVIVSVTYLLPVAALATVTSTLGQILLMLLAAGVYLIGVGTLEGQLPSGFPTSESLVSFLGSGVLIVGCSVVIFWQYRRRWTVRSRGLLGGCAVLIPVVMVSLPYDTLTDHDFPPLSSGQAAQVQLSFHPIGNVPKGGPEAGSEVNIQLPMLATGVGDDSMVAI